MYMTDHPAWPAYKAALARLVEAGSRLEEAQALGSADLCEADQEFQNALSEYTATRERLTDSDLRGFDGAPVPLAWLGPPVSIAVTLVESEGDPGPMAG